MRASLFSTSAARAANVSPRRAAWLALAAFAFLTGCPNTKITTHRPVLTQHNDDQRSGVQLEATLFTGNVSANTFGKLFTIDLPTGPHSRPALLPDRIYTQPLVVESPNPLVIVATDTNMVYAFDAVNPSSQPVWTSDLGVPESAMDTWGDAHCNRSLPVVGVLGTPVITPDQKFMYVVSKNETVANPNPNNTKPTFTIHKLDLSNGHELAAKQITAPSGFDPHFHLQRPGLAWVPMSNAAGGGFVYAAFGGHCDQKPYHGWVFGFDGNLQQVEALNVSPEGNGAGIWQAGQAPVIDTEGCPNACTPVLYLATGNAVCDKASALPNACTSVKHADSVLKLSVAASGKLAVLDSFRPYNAASIDECDADIAATGTVLLKPADRLVASGKQGAIYVLDKTKLGHGTASDPLGDVCHNPDGRGGFKATYAWNSQGDAVIQEFQVSKPFFNITEKTLGHVHGTPVFVDLPGGLELYVWPEMDNLKQYAWNGTKFNQTPEHESSVGKIDGMPGGMLSISTLGGPDAIVWATHPTSEDAWAPSPKPVVSPAPVVPSSIPLAVQGVLFAFNANDVTNPLWSSNGKAQDHVGEFAKFASPTIWNARVYVPTFSGQIQVYGLCNNPTPCK
jgi:hypothetical protein